MRTTFIIIVLALAGLAGGYGSYLIWDHVTAEPPTGPGADTGSAWRGPETATESVIGQAMPDGVVLPALDGGQHDLAEWRGKTLLINFWASWCPPCIREMPVFEELQQEFGGDRFTFIGIAVDNRADAAEFAQKTGVTYPILYGRAEAMTAGDQFGNRRGMLPYSVLVDADGVIQRVWSGELHRADLEPVIREALDTPP